ncbi:sensor histidine kinase [Salinibaculum rarum]|uniref:sensor histidine kinase n=1 Tax=Salinibaculum rarum TaxID=3058903 RepID=UPI00265D6F94|nr:HAMP domain-containing sensor histidine kinase [Salinibaculum sp. KK48]
MASDEHSKSRRDDSKTARTVGQLVKYSRELNQSDTVEEVGTYALEASVHVMDGHPSPTVTEVYQGELRVLESMSPGLSAGDEASAIAQHAYETGKTVILPDAATNVEYTTEDTVVVSAADLGIEEPESGLTIAAPSVYSQEIGEVGVIMTARWDALGRVEEHHVKPLEYLADHVATAVNNIRARERLERARNDLEKRKELIEVYDRLLRHDLGNDLQVIAGFSDAILGLVEDDEQLTEYAGKINQTATDAADLIDRVGDLVKTLERDGNLESRALEPILTDVVENVGLKFDRLTVEYDPADFDYQVFAGDLLDSIFTNILSNAAVHNDGEIAVDVYAEEPTPDTVVVGFADDGAGVADEIRDEIFQMGKKGPESDGTGLGMGLARALTESYGGTVEVRDSDRGGADFRVTLDRA